MKQIVFGKEARARVLEGVNLIADAVSVTMGPGGRTVVIQKPSGIPVITKDGVSVAKEISHSDPVVNLGVELTKSVAKRVVETVGDSTTGATVLTRAIMSRGIDVINSYDESGKRLNMHQFNMGMQVAKEDVLKYLKTISRPVDNVHTIYDVAKISTNDDVDLAMLIKEAYEKCGNDVSIIAESGNREDTTVSYSSGYTFDRGYVNQRFINDLNKYRIVYQNVSVILVNDEIDKERASRLLGFLFDKQMKNTMIVANDFTDEAISLMLSAAQFHKLNVFAVRSPAYGERRLDILTDIAQVVSGRVLHKEDFDVDELLDIGAGYAGQVVVNKNDTLILDGQRVVGFPEKFNEYVKVLEERLSNTTDEFTKGKIADRLLRLKGNSATIRVGGTSDVEVKERRDRLDDAVCAVAQAVKHGIVPGGGAALYHTKQHLLNKKLDGNSLSYIAGYYLVVGCLSANLLQISGNVGINFDDVPGKESMIADHEMTFDPISGQVVNAFENGIIDPLNVVTTALSESVSMCATLLTSECVVVNEPRQGYQSIITD